MVQFDHGEHQLGMITSKMFNDQGIVYSSNARMNKLIKPKLEQMCIVM